MAPIPQVGTQHIATALSTLAFPPVDNPIVPSLRYHLQESYVFLETLTYSFGVRGVKTLQISSCCIGPYLPCLRQDLPGSSSFQASLPVFTDFQRFTLPLEEVAPFRNSSNAWLILPCLEGQKLLPRYHPSPLVIQHSINPKKHLFFVLKCKPSIYT